MEVFRAVADFIPPRADGSHNLLSFSKGEQFEVFDNKKTDWWGARRLNDNTVGYVPAKYLQYEERRIGKLLPNNYHEHREEQVKKFAAMQNSEQHTHPDYYQHVYYEEFAVPEEYLPPPAGEPEVPDTPDIPTPDYDPDTPVAERNSFVFVEKFKNVISHINTIEELYSEVPEPDPDYGHDEDSSDFPPPPPSISNDTLPPPPPSICGDTPPSPMSPTAPPTIIGVRNGAVSSPEDEGEQIQPRKLANPCVASRERQALHKELLLNYKLGKDVLQKPELNKVLAKRKETQKRKEWDEHHTNKRTSLELKLEERATKLKEKDEMKPIAEDDKPTPEFLKMHRRITTKTPTSPPT